MREPIPACTEVTISALLYLIRLLAVELLLKRGDDVEKLLGAMREKIETTPLPLMIEQDAAQKGLGQARELLVPLAEQLRKQFASRADQQKMPPPVNQLPC